MTIIRTAALMLTVVALATPAHGQEPRPVTSPYLDPASGLALTDAIARALSQEPLLRAVRAEVDASRGRLQQAGLRANPTMSFERRIEPGGTDNQNSTGIEWPLELFRRSARVRTARYELDAAQFGAGNRERELAAQVRTQYGAAAAAARDVAVAVEIAATVEGQLALVRSRVDTGNAPPLQRDLIDVDLRRLQTDVLLATGRADTAMIGLKQVLGMKPGEPLALQQSIEALLATDANGIVATEDSIAARPDVREAETRVTVADARIEQARREGRLDVGVYATFMRMDAGFPQLAFSEAGSLERVRGRFNYVAGGAMVTVPLFNRNQGQIAAAAAERAAAEARRDAAELAARAEVAAAQARDRQAQRAVALYGADIRELARHNLAVCFTVG